MNGVEEVRTRTDGRVSMVTVGGLAREANRDGDVHAFELAEPFRDDFPVQLWQLVKTARHRCGDAVLNPGAHRGLSVEASRSDSAGSRFTSIVIDTYGSLDGS